jgi:hypothetical protein
MLPRAYVGNSSSLDGAVKKIWRDGWIQSSSTERKLPMADELSSYEKYAQNIPLNEELAALHDGRDPVEIQKAAARAVVKEEQANEAEGELERELTRVERLDLKELRLSRGWPILVRLLEKSSHRLEKAAITASMRDPLARNPETGERWMEHKMFEIAKNALPKMVAREIEAMDGPIRKSIADVDEVAQ